MDKKYYSYSAEELKEGRIPVKCLGDSGEVFSEIAHIMVDTIEEHNRRGEKTVFICPVGPVGQYPIFVRLVKERNVSLKNCWFFNMDEYLNDDETYIDFESPLSFHGFMNRTVYSQIDPELVMPESQRFFPDPKDPGMIDRKIEELGGVDICFGGIGINGHLAFNEADPTLTCEEFKELRTRVLPITKETRTANAIGDFGGALEDMPTHCVTIGFHEIYNARKIRLGIFRDWHRAVARRAAYGEMTADFPVSILADHPDALIRMTEFVANLPED